MTRLHFDLGGGWEVGLSIREDARGALVSRIVGLDDNEPAPGHAPPLPDVVELETTRGPFRAKTLTVNIAIAGLAEFKRRMAWVQEQILRAGGVETRAMVCPACQATVPEAGDVDHEVKVQPVFGGSRETFIARCRVSERRVRRREVVREVLQLGATCAFCGDKLEAPDIREMLRTLPDADWLTSEVRVPWVCSRCRER